MNGIYNLVFMVQIIITFALIIFIRTIFRLSKAMAYENRISRYSLDALNQNELSLFDNFQVLYYRYRRSFSNSLKRYKFLVKYSKLYERYVDRSKLIPEEEMDFIATKFIFSGIVLIILVLSSVFLNRIIGFSQIAFTMIIGFFVPDLLFLTKDKFYKRDLENDLLKAITIMNNAFKSGNSIMQSIHLASVEIDGPIKDEFKKMYIDLSYGLSLEVVFNRFSKRVNLEEVKYMTTSLTILNKTGGNIAKVFSSIEKSFFERRKLEQEKKALTGSANFLFKILIFTPFIIFALIFFLSPSYFKPLYTTSIGFIILLIIVSIYISYIFIIKKIMKIGDM